jgi:hypothetical protein
MPEVWLAELYLAIDRLFRAVHTGVLAAFEGFWMGVLPDSVTDQISERSYRSGSPFNAPGYLNSGLQIWEETAIQRFFPRGSRVLIAAAGAGREMIALAQAGFEVDGFDSSRALVAAGRQALAARGIEGRLDWAPPCGVPSISGIYGAAIIGWNGYTHIAPRKRRVAFLRSLSPHLCADAPVLVSVFVNTDMGRAWGLTSKIANAVRRLTLRPPTVDAGATFPRRPKQYFRRRQLEAELADAGFALVEWWTWGTSGAGVCRRAPPVAIASATPEFSAR